MPDRTLDPSRYRVARAIIERWEAGENVMEIVDDYGPIGAYVVELIVAAYQAGHDSRFDELMRSDREGKYEDG